MHEQTQRVQGNLLMDKDELKELFINSVSWKPNSSMKELGERRVQGNLLRSRTDSASLSISVHRMKMNSASCSYNSASRMKDLNISLEGELVESTPNSTSRDGIQVSRLDRDSASWRANSASRVN